jgi:NSS family neurotransmitter:Na+ symporter
MQGGYFFSLIFFILLAVAALTSTISMLEVVVTYFVEELKIPRKSATLLAAASISVLGFFAAGSWGWFSNVTLFNQNVFGLLNFASVNLLLPLGGFFIVVFTGWFMGRKKIKAELSSEGSQPARFWLVFLFLIRYIAPIAIAIVFLYGIGIIRF